MLSEANERRSSEKILSLLGLAMKAKKLDIGTDRICDEIRRHGYVSEDDDSKSKIRAVGIVVIASDASENTKKRLCNACSYYGIKCITSHISSEEISKRVGKGTPCAACATFDRGFSNGIENAFESKMPLSF